MALEDRILHAANDKAERGEIIIEYTGYILSCASKVLKKHITTDDDAFSIAIIAFDEAITKFSPEKGSFLSFAAFFLFFSF